MIEGLTIEDSNENFETWLNQDFLSEAIKENIKNASILLVPTIGFREENQPTFPVLTDELFGYFKESLPPDIIIELCIDDDQYQELALHSDYKRIGKFIITLAVLPTFVNLLSTYISHNYIEKDEKKEPTVIIQNIDNSKNTTIVNPAGPKVVEQPAPKKYLEKPKVKFSITVVDSNGTSKEFKYEGSAKDVKKVTDEIKEFWKNGDK